MYRRCVWLLTALSIGLALPLRAADPVLLKKRERIAFLRDSITQTGVGPKGYVTLIKTALAERHPDLGIEVIGTGISGNKVPDLHLRLDRDVLARKPTLVVVYIRINDVWHGEKDPSKGTPKEWFEAGLKDVVGRIQDAGARVVLCTPTVSGEKNAGSNSIDTKLDEYSDVSRSVVARRPYIFVTRERPSSTSWRPTTLMTRTSAS